MSYPKFSTQESVDAYLDEHRQKMRRYAGHTLDELASTFQPDEGPESKLQAKIEKWAHEWGKPILSFRQTPKIKRVLPPGWPDVALILPKGMVVWLELKSHKGRLSEEQKQMKIQFMHLGHTIHEVRSFRQFLEIMKGEKS